MSRSSLNLLFVCFLGLLGTSLLFAQTSTKPPKPTDKKPEATKPADTKKDKEKTEKDKTLSDFMREKLKASNKILEGMTVEDYDLILEGAKKLEKLSSAEKWRASNDAMYRHHSAEFRRVVKKMKEAAEKKDLDAAALAWVSTTMNCIECHKYVRTILVTGN